MLQPHFTTAKTLVIISSLCLLSLSSLSLATELGKQTKSIKITPQNTTKALESKKNQLETTNSGHEMDTIDLQKKIQSRSQAITTGTQIIHDINKERENCIRTGCKPPSTQKKIVSPTKKAAMPALQPRGVSPNQPQALPKIKIPSKLQQPSVQLNNKPVQLKPAKKGGFSPAPKKPDLGVGENTTGGFTAPTVGVKNQLPKVKAAVTPTLKTPQLTTKPVEARKPKPKLTLSPSSSTSPAPSKGGFVPPGVSGQIGNHNALSPQDLAKISGVREQWERYKRAVAEKKRRDEAEMQARIERLSEQAYLSGADCDDTRSDVYPGAPEKCDGIDNNCNKQIDEGLTIHVYPDLDQDGHGAAGSDFTEQCQQDINRSMDEGHYLAISHNDCDDTDPDHWHDCAAAAE